MYLYRLLKKFCSGSFYVVIATYRYRECLEYERNDVERILLLTEDHIYWPYIKLRHIFNILHLDTTVLPQTDMQ